MVGLGTKSKNEYLDYVSKLNEMGDFLKRVEKEALELIRKSEYKLSFDKKCIDMYKPANNYRKCLVQSTV